MTTLKIFYYILTFDMVHSLAFNIDRAEQQTRALELDRPALLGTVPSTTALKPRNVSDWKCSLMP